MADDRCGGTEVTTSHTKSYTFANALADKDLMMRPDHQGTWHWAVVAHQESEGSGFFAQANEPGPVAVYWAGTQDALGFSAMNRQKTFCHETGHNFGLKHPADNANHPGDDTTCMYQGKRSFLNYGQHSNAQAVKQAELDALGKHEWKYVIKFLTDGN